MSRDAAPHVELLVSSRRVRPSPAGDITSRCTMLLVVFRRRSAQYFPRCCLTAEGIVICLSLSKVSTTTLSTFVCMCSFFTYFRIRLSVTSSDLGRTQMFAPQSCPRHRFLIPNIHIPSLLPFALILHFSVNPAIFLSTRSPPKDLSVVLFCIAYHSSVI